MWQEIDRFEFKVFGAVKLQCFKEQHFRSSPAKAFN
jgi:hypothetical protein